MKTRKRAIKWAAIVVIALLLFTIAKSAALRERGYEGIGGEYMILLLPAIYYAAERTAKDWITDLRELKGKGHRK